MERKEEVMGMEGRKNGQKDGKAKCEGGSEGECINGRMNQNREKGFPKENPRKVRKKPKWHISERGQAFHSPKAKHQLVESQFWKSWWIIRRIFFKLFTPYYNIHPTFLLHIIIPPTNQQFRCATELSQFDSAQIATDAPTSEQLQRQHFVGWRSATRRAAETNNGWIRSDPSINSG